MERPGYWEKPFYPLTGVVGALDVPTSLRYVCTSGVPMGVKQRGVWFNRFGWLATEVRSTFSNPICSRQFSRLLSTGKSSRVFELAAAREYL